MLRPSAIGECVEAAGGLQEGILLLAVILNYESLPEIAKQRRLFRWVAKPRQAWIAETGLKLDQLKRALKKLKDRGLLDSRRASHRGQVIGHVRLTEAAESWARSRGLLPPESGRSNVA